VYIVIVIFYMHINITNIVCTILFTRKKAKKNDILGKYSYAHRDCIWLIKNTVKIVIL